VYATQEITKEKIKDRGRLKTQDPRLRDRSKMTPSSSKRLTRAIVKTQSTSLGPAAS